MAAIVVAKASSISKSIKSSKSGAKKSAPKTKSKPVKPKMTEIKRTIAPEELYKLLETKAKSSEHIVAKVGEHTASIKDNVATLNETFKVDVGLLKILERNIRKSTNTLLVGETGCGKTELIANVAKLMNLPLTILDMGTMTDPVSGLIGIHIVTIKDGITSSEFRKSRFSDVIQQPGIILLDELSRANVQSNNLLFPCLDFRRELPMEYCFEATAPIKVHPKCVFIATANLGSQYTGTHKIDRALLDRFMVLRVSTPESQAIKESLSKTFTGVPANKVAVIVKTYEKIIKAHAEYKIDFTISFRHLKYVTDLVQDGFEIYDAFYSIVNGMTVMDSKIIEQLIGTPAVAEVEAA